MSLFNSVQFYPSLHTIVLAAMSSNSIYDVILYRISIDMRLFFVIWEGNFGRCLYNTNIVYNYTEFLPQRFQVYFLTFLFF